jgi:hypothetical protein
MRFAILTWAHENTSVGTLFGVLDADNPSWALPVLGSRGYWAVFKTLDEARFPAAAEAKKGIAADGYYLMGAGPTIKEAFGDPPAKSTQGLS